jgi:hypothetical protein
VGADKRGRAGVARAEEGSVKSLRRVSVLLFVLAVGCSGKASADHPGVAAEEPIKECEVYLSSFERCLGTLGPKAIATERVNQARTALVAEASHSAEGLS